MNLSRLLKAFVPSLVPLLVFVAADAFFGEEVGFAVGLAVGAGEFLFVLVRDRSADPFVAADTLLLALAGGLSILLRDDLFFKLKPAVIEAVLAGAFALLLVLPPRHLKAYLERQLRGFEFADSGLPAMRRSLGLMLGVLCLHVLLTAYAALALSTAAWGFVSGGLLYILFGLMALGEYLSARRKSRLARAAAGAAPGEEILPLVDEEGRVVGTAPRSACHAGPGMLHPVVHLQVFDGKGNLYLQKRAACKEVEAGKWDSAVGGHVAAGEDLGAALARELKEELGVTAMALEAAGARPEPVLRYRWESGRESELVFSYALRYEGPFAPDRREVEEGRFWSPAEIAEAAGKGLLTPNFEREYALLAEAARRAESARRAEAAAEPSAEGDGA